MRLRLLCCNVFVREACLCIADSPHTIDPVFTEIGEHVHPEQLCRRLQSLIEEGEASDVAYDATVLLFGLCGNATLGLRPGRIPLVIPRAHDCCTILLGSREAFVRDFGENPSMPFSSCGYLERGEYFLRTGDDQSEKGLADGFQAYVDQYGEENAKYVWELLHPSIPENNRAIFIGHDETAGLGFADGFRVQAEADGRVCECRKGDLSLIRNLLHGNWEGADFLVVHPGEKISGVYDMEEVMRAVPGD